jgi:ABC-2 type transport system permease protein
MSINERSEGTVGASLDRAAIRTVLAVTERPSRAGALSVSLTFGWRGMLKLKHVPEQLLDVILAPVLWVVMFIYLFGGAIAGSTGAYRDYLVPGILVVGVMFTTVYSGVAVNTDLTKGVVDRFRSLPIWRPAPLFGALLGDGVRYSVSAAVTIVVGLILGFRPDGGVLGVLAAVGLVVLFAFGMSWVYTALGLVLRSPAAVTSTSYTLLFPLTFLSSAFVEPDTLPAGLEAIVNANPVSALVDASRGLMEGNAAGGDIAVVLATTAVLTAILLPLTTHLYRTRA